MRKTIGGRKTIRGGWDKMTERDTHMSERFERREADDMCSCYRCMIECVKIAYRILHKRPPLVSHCFLLCCVFWAKSHRLAIAILIIFQCSVFFVCLFCVVWFVFRSIS